MCVWAGRLRRDRYATIHHRRVVHALSPSLPVPPLRSGHVHARARVQVALPALCALRPGTCAQADLELWGGKLWDELLRLHPLPDGTAIDDTPSLEPPVPIRWLPEAPANGAPAQAPAPKAPPAPPAATGVTAAVVTEAGEGAAAARRELQTRFYAAPLGSYAGGSGGASAPILAKVLRNDRLTAKDWTQDVRHIELELPPRADGAPHPFVAGDVAVVYPQNTFLGPSWQAGSAGWRGELPVTTATAKQHTTRKCPHSLPHSTHSLL